MTRATLAVTLMLGTGLVAGSARAEHEVYYRYTVLGYVKDTKGRPLRGREVTVVRDKTGFSYLGESDEAGLYVVVLRLGDESVGERLTLHVGERTASVRVRFDTANRTDERGTRVDVEGPRLVERAAWFSSTLARFLGSASR